MSDEDAVRKNQQESQRCCGIKGEIQRKRKANEMSVRKRAKKEDRDELKRKGKE